MNTPQTKGWWDAVVDPATGQPQGYFLGGFIDDVWSAGKNFVVNNPWTTAGTALGALTGGSKGALAGLALGGLGDAAFTPTSYASQWLGTNNNTGGLFSGFGDSPSAPAGGYTGASGAPGASTSSVSYAPALPAPDMGSAAATSAPSAGITGAFGGAGATMDFAADGMGPPVSAMGGAGVTDRIGAGLKQVSDWGKANPRMAQAGIQLASGLYGMNQQRKLDDMQKRATARGDEAYAYNRNVADASNRTAQEEIDTARSVYNPYNMATQSYAQAQQSGQRAVDDIGKAGLSMGRSPGTVAAEQRRAKLNTSLGATTAYNTGFRTGADLQRGGVASGNSMRRTLTAPGYDSGLGNAMQGRADADSAQITALLENYLGNPTAVKKRQDVEANGALRQ